MSRTYRRMQNCGYSFRRPKGRINAILNNARKSSIPPDPWDDDRVGRENCLPRKVAGGMIDKGMHPEDVANRLHHKFKIPKYIALRIAREEATESYYDYTHFQTIRDENNKKMVINYIWSDQTIEELEEDKIDVEKWHKMKYTKKVYYRIPEQADEYYSRGRIIGIDIRKAIKWMGEYIEERKGPEPELIK